MADVIVAESSSTQATSSVGPPAGTEEFSFNGNDFTEFELSNDAYPELTIELWAKRGAREQGIMLFHSGVGRQYPGVWVTGDLQWVAGGGARYPNGVKTNLQLPHDTWVHLAFVKNAPANQMLVYVNGVETVNAIGGTNDREAHTAPTAIGIFRLGHSLPTLANGWSEPWMAKYGFEGQMAEVRIWKAVRTPEQILAGMKASTAQLPSKADLLLYGPVGGNLTQPSFPVAPPAGCEEFSFNGNNFTEFELSNDAYPGLTIELWLKRGPREPRETMLFHSGIGRHYPGVRVTGDVQWVAGGGARYPNGLTASNIKLPQDTWMHLAFVKNATESEMLIYADGVEVVNRNRRGSTDDRHKMDAPTAIGLLRLGHSLPPLKNGWSEDWMKKYGFEGQMAEVRIWNVVRTPEEILAGMRVKTAELPSKAGLLLYGPVKGKLARPK